MRPYDRKSLTQHDREEKFNPAFDPATSNRARVKKKRRQPFTKRRYRYAGRGRWERVDVDWTYAEWRDHS